MEEQSKIMQDITALEQDELPYFPRAAFDLLVRRYDRGEDEQCIEGCQYVLSTYSISGILSMKLCVLISMSSKDWHDAEHYRKRAEHLYAILLDYQDATDTEAVSQAGNTSTLELLQTESHDPEKPTISRIYNLPIRVAGTIVRGSSRPQNPVPEAGNT
ncbi:hypothetical protein KCU77_g5589, partial [Aureobasidium melanogenum]